MILADIFAHFALHRDRIQKREGVLFFLFNEKAAEVQGKCAGPRTPDDVALRVSRTLQKDT